MTGKREAYASRLPFERVNDEGYLCNLAGRRRPKEITDNSLMVAFLFESGHFLRMKKWIGYVMGWMVLLTMVSSTSHSAVYYVNASNMVPLSPFNTWDTAATNIQDAINVAQSGDTVLVTNGTYSFGGEVLAGDLVNRIAVTNAISVQSVNGPWVTAITGGSTSNGPTAVRCAWLSNGASLTGFTLTAGATRAAGDPLALESGGAVWCASANAFVRNCVIVSNAAANYGGAVYQGTVHNSLISSNAVSLATGGAVYGSVLVNCTVVSNATYGVVSPLAMTNCIIYYNSPLGDIHGGGFVYTHCCASILSPLAGNFTNAPLLFADGVHLDNNSPCRGTGTNTVSGTDIFGMTWSNPPSIGCAEWQPAPLVSTPRLRLFPYPAGFSLGGISLAGAGPDSFTWFKDGRALSDDGHFAFTQNTNLTVTGLRLSDAGQYQLVVSNSFGVVTSAVAQLVIHTVNAAGANPV